MLRLTARSIHCFVSTGGTRLPLRLTGDDGAISTGSRRPSILSRALQLNELARYGTRTINRDPTGCIPRRFMSNHILHTSGEFVAEAVHSVHGLSRHSAARWIMLIYRRLPATVRALNHPAFPLYRRSASTRSNDLYKRIRALAVLKLFEPVRNSCP